MTDIKKKEYVIPETEYVEFTYSEVCICSEPETEPVEGGGDVGDDPPDTVSFSQMLKRTFMNSEDWTDEGADAASVDAGASEQSVLEGLKEVFTGSADSAAGSVETGLPDAGADAAGTFNLEATGGDSGSAGTGSGAPSGQETGW